MRTLAIMLGILMLASLIPSMAAADPDFCQGGTLDNGAPLGQTGPDLVITNMTCTVDGTKKPYNFHNVYIFGNGTLSFSDATMDFYAANILVQNQGVLSATGIGGNNDGNILTIHLYGDGSESGITCKKLVGKTLTDDDTCGVPDGANGSAKIWSSNKMDMRYPAMPCTKSSQLKPPTLLPGGVNDCFYQYSTFDKNDLPNAYFGRKVLALSYGGTINLSGYKGAQGGNDNDPSVTGSSWMRLNATLNGGEGSLMVSGMPADWKMNDNIVVTATDYLPGHAEQLQVASVDGSKVTLTGTVKNPHWGQTYSLMNVPCNPTEGSLSCEFGPDLLPGQQPDDRNVDMRAAVGLLSRSIRIVSDGPTANSAFTGYYGGHTVVRQGFLSYQVQGVEFYQLGQGGAKGHYPVHFHMARKTPAGTYVKDSSVWDSMTRWITLHATQGVTLARNVGYKSIGHGYYLEDGTEADNVLNTNLGVFARAAVQNAQNDREVPGILAEPNDPGAPPPYHSDWEFPTVFWIMNGWNDFQYNFASSAGTCGVCYWLLPGGISGPSQYEWFDGYAGQQVVNPYNMYNGEPAPINQAGYSPLKRFVGNSCSTAMSSFLNVGETAPCAGVANTDSLTLVAVRNDDAPPKNPVAGADNYYPYVTGLRNPTQCTGANCRCDPGQPGCNVPCSGFGPGQANCVVTTLDRYTTSFNWAHKNFSAIWLRPWWFLVQNSAITDVQQGGLTFVTSGGYTRSDIAQGYWSLLRKSVLVGNTQSTTGEPDNHYASSAGPFNPDGLKCDFGGPPNLPYCLSKVQGISYPAEFFSMNQRLFNIYDGPAYQEHNAYLDTPASKIGKRPQCTTDGTTQTCSSFGYLYGQEYGVPADITSSPSDPECYLPNAAIAWKQSNGFFYPPAFHSDNLFFSNVDIRHFVIEPDFNYGTFTTKPDAVKNRYCTWTTTMFNNFTDIDRQTELNDDDGSLTGLLGQLGTGSTRETISVNEDNFFNAPTVTVECASDLHGNGTPATDPPATADTSPYEYITTATIAKCGINYAGCRVNLPLPTDCSQSTLSGYCAWGNSCTDGSGPRACYGVPLYRQYLTGSEYTQYWMNPKDYQRPAIRMMGQAQGQRSTLTVNHGKYYIDDQVPVDAQLATKATELNVYMPNETYYTYFLYAKSSMNQTYQMFVGYGLNKQQVIDSVKPYRAILNDNNFIFNPATGASFLDVTYDDKPLPTGTGLVTITVHLDAYAEDFKNDEPQFCRPMTYCKASGNQCECAPGSGCTDNSVCAWSIKDIDCPLSGCFAFGITMPGTFKTGIAKPPAPGKFTDDPNYKENWATGFYKTANAGAQCTYK